MKGVNVDKQYALGFVSAVLLIAGASLISQAVAWVKVDPQPGEYIEFLHTPVFSIYDIFAAVLALMVLALLVTVPYWGPRA